MKSLWIALSLIGCGGAALAQQPAPVSAQQQAPGSTPIARETTAPYSDTRDLGRGVDVLDRFENELPSEGIRAGAFVLRPELRGTLLVDDNIFASSNNERSDLIGVLGLGGRASSDIPRHALGFRANADVYRYYDNSSENYWIGELGTSGRYDIDRDTSLGADLSARRLVEPRDDPDSLGGTEPTVYYAYRGAASARDVSGNIVSRLETGLQWLDYEDTPTSTGTISGNSRNRDELFADGQIGYRYLGMEEVYLRARVNQRNFDQAQDSNGFRRESDGYRADLGATADLGGLVRADASIGYQEQSYDDPRFGAPGSLVGNLGLLWNPAASTSVRGEGAYEFVESLSTGTPGYWRSVYSVRVAHELTRDYVVIGRLILQERDFERTNREDTVYGADIGLRYRIDRGLFLDAEYRFREQESSTATGDYTRNIVLLQLRRTF